MSQYARENRESAFTKLVEIHAGMVFGTALRLTADRGAAEEISQDVFVILARKARTLNPNGPLGGWLHRTTLLVSRNYLRQRRRRNRKIQALRESRKMEPSEVTAVTEVLSVLDDAIDQLSATDRQILMLRFFDGLSIRQIAAATGKSEAASQRQSHRALQKLSRLLKRRGIVAPIAMLASQLSPETSKAAPAGMTISLSRTALQRAPAISPSGYIINTILTMLHSKTVILTTGGIAAATAIAISIGFGTDKSNPNPPSAAKSSETQETQEAQEAESKENVQRTAAARATSAQLRGDMVLLPAGSFRLPPAWLDHYREYKNNLHLSSDQLEQVNKGNGEWDTAFAKVVNAVLPFKNCVFHGGGEGWGSDGVAYSDLQMRAYAGNWKPSEVREFVMGKGLPIAKTLIHASKKSEHERIASSSDASKNEDGWQTDSLEFLLWFSDYGATAKIDFYTRTQNGATAVLVFMYTDFPRKQKTQLELITSSFQNGSINDD